MKTKKKNDEDNCVNEEEEESIINMFYVFFFTFQFSILKEFHVQGLRRERKKKKM